MLFSQPVFALYAMVSCALVVSLYGLGFKTAFVRNARRAIVNHEDVKVNFGASLVEVEHPDVQRIKRAHQNALENAVPFFAIGFLYTQTFPSRTVATAFFLIFFAVRMLHAGFYLTARQPFRTISFAVGALINLAMVVQVMRVALR